MKVQTPLERRGIYFFFFESCLQSLKPIDDKTLFILPRGFPLLDVLPFKCNQMYSSPKIFCIICFLAQLLETVRYEDHHLCFLPLLPTGYGMTELSPVCHMTPAGNDKHGSVGVLLPNLRCKVKLSRYLDRETACMHQMDRPHIHHNIT